jgi:hypothetical protein
LSIHRDDLPPELLEKIAGQFPGMKVVCVGDVPSRRVPQNVLDELRRVKESHLRSLALGTCVDCGSVMPGYPPPDQPLPKDWEPADEWLQLTDMATGDLLCWQCPECAYKDVA